MKETLLVLLVLVAISCAHAAVDAPVGSNSTHPCNKCISQGLICLGCKDGRHACISSDQAYKNPTCCGCRGTGPGSICTLCLPNEPCIASAELKSGFYCYNRRYLTNLYYSLNETRPPSPFRISLPTKAERAGLIAQGVLAALFVPLAATFFIATCIAHVLCNGCSGGGGGGDGDGGSDWGNSNSSWDNNSSSWDNGGSSWDSGGGGGGDNGGGWDSGPSNASSAD